MSEPRTEAGRALKIQLDEDRPYEWNSGLIAAIEAEMDAECAATVERLRAADEALAALGKMLRWWDSERESQP